MTSDRPPVPADRAPARSAPDARPAADGSAPDSPPAVDDAAAVIAAALDGMGVPVLRDGDDAFLVTLPGERRYRTMVWLIVGAHEVLVESFVCRKPDENPAGVYRYLLQRNASLRTVAYALDAVGDIHLVGRLARSAVSAAEIDTLLGVVLAASDRDFNPILERGFADAIRREWAWRTARGDSVKNLQAFRHLIAE